MSSSENCMSLMTYRRTASISSGLTTLPACLIASLSCFGENMGSGWPLVRAACSRACNQTSRVIVSITITQHAEHTHQRLYNQATNAIYVYHILQLKGCASILPSILQFTHTRLQLLATINFDLATCPCVCRRLRVALLCYAYDARELRTCAHALTQLYICI